MIHLSSHKELFFMFLYEESHSEIIIFSFIKFMVEINTVFDK